MAQTTSHDHARQLQQLAELLLSKPAFPMNKQSFYIHLSRREEMIEAVKAFGAGAKGHTDYWFTFTPALPVPGLSLEITIHKAEICRKVQEEIWECDPLLSGSLKTD